MQDLFSLEPVSSHDSLLKSTLNTPIFCAVFASTKYVDENWAILKKMGNNRKCMRDNGLPPGYQDNLFKLKNSLRNGHTTKTLKNKTFDF